MTPGEQAYAAYRDLRGWDESSGPTEWSDLLDVTKAAWEAAAAAVANLPRAYLVCDACGQFHEDSQENLSASCDCGRFLQRTEWVTLADLRKMRDELAALRAVVERHRWISVAERLPEDMQDVAFVVAHGAKDFACRIFGGRYVADRWVGFTVPGIHFGGSVSHWMPLPDPPQALAAAEAARKEAT